MFERHCFHPIPSSCLCCAVTCFCEKIQVLSLIVQNSDVKMDNLPSINHSPNLTDQNGNRKRFTQCSLATKHCPIMRFMSEPAKTHLHISYFSSHLFTSRSSHAVSQEGPIHNINYNAPHSQTSDTNDIFTFEDMLSSFVTHHAPVNCCGKCVTHFWNDNNPYFSRMEILCKHNLGALNKSFVWLNRREYRKHFRDNIFGR